MRRFDRAGGSFFEPLQIIDGPQTRGLIRRPPNVDRPGAEYAHPSLVLRVKPSSLVRAGHVVRLPGGGHYLVASHSETIDWRSHHLFRCDRQVSWQRPGVQLDSLTKLPTGGGAPQDLGPIWVMWERVRREFTDLTLRVAQERHLIATGADMKIGDRVEGMTVDRINIALGVKIVELKG